MSLQPGHLKACRARELHNQDQYAILMKQISLSSRLSPVKKKKTSRFQDRAKRHPEEKADGEVQKYFDIPIHYHRKILVQSVH